MCFPFQLTLNEPVSPPHVVGLANGLAQCIVSLARFVGPVLGGYVGFSIVYSKIYLADTAIVSFGL